MSEGLRLSPSIKFLQQKLADCIKNSQMSGRVSSLIFKVNRQVSIPIIL